MKCEAGCSVGHRIGQKWFVGFLYSFLLFYCFSTTVGAETKVYPSGQPINIYVESGQCDVLDNGEKVYKNCQGIGTLTYTTDTEYAALGHGIYDEKGELFPIAKGEIYQSTLQTIVKGKKGKPGELVGNGTAGSTDKMGSIIKNSKYGIYGTIDKEVCHPEEEKAFPLATNLSEIQEGHAVIRSWVSGEPQYYHIQILKTNAKIENGETGMMIQVTDKELLKLTGGIVQGMSGSPIIQDGKLIGAVTHVLVKDPTRGYGVFIENMLEH
jgi:stage IV sporulation protein B